MAGRPSSLPCCVNGEGVILWKRPRVFDVDVVGAAAVALLLVLGMTLVLRPMWGVAKSLPQWRRSCDSVGRELLAERRSERQLRERLAELRKELESEDRQLHDRGALDICLQRVAQLCRRHGVQVDEVRPEADIELPACVVSTVGYKGRAPVEGLRAFLADLEEETQFLDVYSLVVCSERPGSPGPYRVEWTLRAFFRLPQAVQGLADVR